MPPARAIVEWMKSERFLPAWRPPVAVVVRADRYFFLHKQRTGPWNDEYVRSSRRSTAIIIKNDIDGKPLFPALDVADWLQRPHWQLQLRTLHYLRLRKTDALRSSFQSRHSNLEPALAVTKSEKLCWVACGPRLAYPTKAVTDVLTPSIVLTPLGTSSM